MKKIGILLLSSILTACGSYNAADTLTRGDQDTKDIARCGGGLGIKNNVGLILKQESQKLGGDLSGAQSSDIIARITNDGLIKPGEDKNYLAYLQCIMELDKRRRDSATNVIEKVERLQQPTLKVYTEALDYSPGAGFNRRLVVENTGAELSELKVVPAPFLRARDFCGDHKLMDCSSGKGLKASQQAFIPIERFYSSVTMHGNYTGELYSREEAPPPEFDQALMALTENTNPSRVGPMHGHVIKLVKVTYKDKFQNAHERFFDVSYEQREIPHDLGEALFALHLDGVRTGMVIDARKASASTLRSIWSETRRPDAKLPTSWLDYQALMDDA